MGIVYHYCGVETFLNILRNHTIRMSDLPHIGVRPHKEKINISKEIINKTRGAEAPYAALSFTHLSVVSSR